MAAAVDLFGDTHWSLEQWGLWVRSNTDGGYPSRTPYLPELSGGIGQARIGDDWGLMIDGAVTALKSRNQLLGRAVKAYYLAGCNLAYVVRKLGVTRRQANDLVNAGVSWIDSYLGTETIQQKGLTSVPTDPIFCV